MAGIGTCAAAGCQVADGGSCIEGFERLTECPNYLQTPPNDAEVSTKGAGSRRIEPTPAPAAEAAEAPLSLSSGNALTAQEGHQLTGECLTKVVVLMGMVKSGKTTVLAELYEQLCRGPFAGHLFAGSRTIIGFERICYLSRAASQRSAEDTERTKRGTENNLLHLDLVAQDGGRRHRLLISDLSGELFEAATNATDDVYAIPYLRRADHVVLFADSEKLSDNSQRQYLLNQLLVLLRSCIEGTRICDSSILTLVVSRHDLLAADVDRTFFDFLETRLRERTGRYFREPIRFLDLAARPTTGEVYGLGDLLQVWLQDFKLVPVFEGSHRGEAPVREIDRFAYKGGAR